MVERMLCMYEAPGSIPGISIAMFFFLSGRKYSLLDRDQEGKRHGENASVRPSIGSSGAIG